VSKIKTCLVCCDSVSCVGLPATPTLVANMTGTTMVYATAHLNDQVFITRSGLAQVFVYNTALQPTRNITFSGFSTYLLGLAASAIDNYLYVGDSNNNVVHRVDLSVTSTVSVVTWSVPGGPQGISMTSENNVLVATTSFTTNQHTIKEYTPIGSLVRNITTSDNVLQAVQVNAYVWAFTQYSVSTRGQICTALATNGTVIKCFGLTTGPGLTLAMWTPRGMVIDTRGYMLIADSDNNRILLVNSTLTSARQLQLPVYPTFSCPQTISYDQSIGRLYVGERVNPYRVLVFDGVWW